MNWKFTNMRLSFCFGLLVIFSLPVAATEIVHRFENPNFGGSPSNGSVLLGEATAQNKLKDPSIKPSVKTPPQTPTQRFISSLQSSILSRLTGTTTQALFDKNGNLKLGATLNFDPTGDGSSTFSVTVGDAAVDGNVTITITDGITDTSLTVPLAAPIL